jgi:hypothetical protein
VRVAAARPRTGLVVATALSGCATTAPTKREAPNPTRLTLLAPTTRVLGTSLRLKASSDNDLAVLRVDFLRDGRAFSSDDTAPFEATLSLSEADNGPLVASAIASGLGGARVGSEAVNLTVAVDRTPPHLSFTSPAISQRSRYLLGGEARDENGIASLKLVHNGDTVALVTASSGFSATVELAEGENSFVLAATDSAGNSAREATLVWFRRAVPGDATPPYVTVAVNPASTRTEGPLSLSAQASDENGIAAMDFLWDGNVIATVNQPPYEVSLPVTSADNGQHSLTARAYDRAGNDATSAAASVQVSIPEIIIDRKSVTPGGYASVSGHIVDDASGVALTASVDGGAPIEVDLLDNRFTYMQPVGSGTHTVTFRLSDSEGGSSSASVNLVVP